MAFDQNLEADRIDGFNIFSAFVRVPLLVLGGILGVDESLTSNDIDNDSLSNRGKCIDDGAENDISSQNNLDDRFPVTRTSSTNEFVQQRQPSNTSNPDAPKILTDPGYHNSGIKRTKKMMSWSDESGLPLVYENDESISHDENKSSPYTSVTGSFHKPTKSAMRKSRSIRHVSQELSDQDENTPRAPSRYIPNMNPRTPGKGLIIPTRPYGRYASVDNKMLGSNGSEMSPQWGWYINTTPPTPELYYSRSMSQSLPSSATTQKHQLVQVDCTKNTTLTSARPILGNSDGKSCQNQVFQNLQNSTKRNPVGGWTSIPI